MKAGDRVAWVRRDELHRPTDPAAQSVRRSGTISADPVDDAWVSVDPDVPLTRQGVMAARTLVKRSGLTPLGPGPMIDVPGGRRIVAPGQIHLDAEPRVVHPATS